MVHVKVSPHLEHVVGIVLDGEPEGAVGSRVVVKDLGGVGRGAHETERGAPLGVLRHLRGVEAAAERRGLVVHVLKPWAQSWSIIGQERERYKINNNSRYLLGLANQFFNMIELETSPRLPSS